MNENITNDLRQSAQWINEMEHESWFGTAELQLEAADEIERLWAENERLRAAGDALADDVDVALHSYSVGIYHTLPAWREARREP